MPDRDELQVPRQVYRLRVLGLALGFICVGTVFYQRAASPIAWTLLAVHAFFIEELGRRKIALPAIVMTGHADVRSMERLRALNTVGCLEKPFRVSELKEILGRWWSTTLGRGEPPWPE